MGTQKDVAERIIKRKADYVLALRGNQGLFYKEVMEYMDYALENKIDKINISKKRTMEKGHGRIEVRE